MQPKNVEDASLTIVVPVDPTNGGYRRTTVTQFAAAVTAHALPRLGLKPTRTSSTITQATSSRQNSTRNSIPPVQQRSR